MGEPTHTPPVSPVVPFCFEGETNKVTALPVNRDSASVSQTVRIAFMRKSSASRMRVAER